VASTVVFIVATAVLSVAGYRWIEEPMIQIGKHLAERTESSRLVSARSPSPEVT
jgi:peptidoglycan/LPS O-acetylase OafA/YrhL